MPMKTKPKRQTRLDNGDIVVDVRHFDVGGIQGKVVRTDEGYLRADAAVTRVGVFNYRNSDGSVRKELRHPDDVFRSDSLDTLKMKPVTKNHPAQIFVNAQNADAYSVGHTGEIVRPSGKLVMSSLIITHKDGIDGVEKEDLKEISCGYKADLSPESGTFDGQHYDCRQINIRYNHVALVKRGRAGAEVRLNIDHADNNDVEYSILDDTLEHKDSNSPTKGGRVMPFTVRLDNGLAYEVEQQEVAKAFDDLRVKVDSTDKTTIELKNEVSKLKADNDTEKAKVADLQKKLDEQDAVVADKVKERVALVSTASLHVDKDTVAKLDTMSDKDIRKAVILVKFPDAKLDEADDVYIAARFDSAIEMLRADDKDGKKRTIAMARQRERTTEKKTDSSESKLDAAEEAYRKRMEDAWKPAEKK